ncbi:MAG: glycyl-radical enzyme activating protein [Desulforhopalus sp.]
MNSLQTTIFAIKRYALHDGPNIRTTIFFKGCPLSCQWCHNPEGIEFGLKLLNLEEKCVGCGECVDICPENALKLTPTGIIRDKDLCTLCGTCVDTCPALAHEATGWVISTDELLDELKKDLPFFEQSGGGVTISGGEPLCQPESLTALLQGCETLGIHRAVDTSGYVSTDTLLEISPHVDLFLYDLKHMDNTKHQQLTGVGNDKILHNLKVLAQTDRDIRIRIPLMSNINDDEANIRATGIFAAGCKTVQGIDILPYHPSATAKYRKLGMTYQGGNFSPTSPQGIARVTALLQEYITDVRIGG